jgi:acyl-CoA thioester hydrolase
VMVGYDIATKEPKQIAEEYKQAICAYEGKTMDDLAKK